MSDSTYFRRDHRKEAARLRVFAANATTAVMKARLIEEAEKHDQLARGDKIADEVSWSRC